jgi:hypothetical protein
MNAVTTPLLFAGVIIGTLAMSHAVNAAPPRVEYRYVGLTTHQDDGRFEYRGLIGISAMHQACVDTFGSSARTATVLEAFFRDDEDQEPRLGWVAPTGPILITEDGAGLFVAFHAETGNQVSASLVSEHLAARNAYCRQYRSPGADQTAAVDANATLVLTSCDAVLPAACSALVAVASSP